ncbi:hypothetical protein [Desulfosporosinus sp. FKB]|uniref:hypothetical protein n=1 Tax=Desulfosporosinus sp. FKB TaxID=1969835 RepID=UPI001FA91C75|nr:hypothetical protein [Desulfosporosinus sp. FKB]
MFRRLVSSYIVFTIIIVVLFTGGCKAISKETRETAKTIAKSDTNSPNIISEAIKHALEKSSKTNSGNQLRKFPYPFDGMLAISSDIDLSTVDKFESYHRFLNTKEQTPYGQGLGLDIADSAWMYVGSDYSEKIDQKDHSIVSEMSYFQGLDSNHLKDADKIVHYFKVGWIDSLHTFGDFSRDDKKILFTRNLAVAAWKTMNESGFKPKVWINHGSPTNAQNFGAYSPKEHFFNYQGGDNPKSPYYHTDLTIGNGIRYVWNSVGKSQFTYDNPLFPLRLRDGRLVWGFFRYTDDIIKHKIDWTWETNELPYQITKQRLDQLVKEGKYSIVAQHLGKGIIDFPFNSADIQTLQMLKTYQDEGKILVSRTVRLLDYDRSQKYVNYSIAQIEGKTYININSIDDPLFGKEIPTLDEIRGITFYVDNPESTYVLLNYNIIPENEIQRNGPDRDNKKSIGIRWFKPDYTDYTKINN